MNKEKEKWRKVLSAMFIVGATTVGCSQPAFGKEKEIKPTKTQVIFISPTATKTETLTPAETATLTPTETPTPTLTMTSTATETLTPTPTNTNTATPTLTLVPSPSETISIKEINTNVRYPIASGNPSRPETALTIDDGYDKTSVEKMLKILKEKKIKCTFFVSGQYLLAYPDLWKKAIEDGHQICNHSATHSMEWKDGVSEKKAREDVLAWEQSVVNVLGKEYLTKMKTEFPYVRFPFGGGNKNPEILKIAQDLGYIPVWYSVIPEANGGIFLLHFIPTDANKLENIIDEIGNKGLKAVTVSELLR